MDERQRKSRYTWGSMPEFGFACKIALCNCAKYMRASSVEVPTVYLLYSWLSSPINWLQDMRMEVQTLSCMGARCWRTDAAGNWQAHMN